MLATQTITQNVVNATLLSRKVELEPEVAETVAEMLDAKVDYDEVNAFISDSVFIASREQWERVNMVIMDLFYLMGRAAEVDQLVAA